MGFKGGEADMDRLRNKSDQGAWCEILKEKNLKESQHTLPPRWDYPGKGEEKAIESKSWTLSSQPPVCEMFPFHVSMSIAIAMVQILFVKPFLWETVEQQNSWYSGSYTLSIPSSVVFPEL